MTSFLIREKEEKKKKKKTFKYVCRYYASTCMHACIINHRFVSLKEKIFITAEFYSFIHSYNHTFHAHFIIADLKARIRARVSLLLPFSVNVMSIARLVQ